MGSMDLIPILLIFALICTSFSSDTKEYEYISQGTEEELLNIEKAIGWYERYYGYDIRDKFHSCYDTPEEVYEVYNEYIKQHNLTEEEFPIYDFRGDE